MLNEPQYSELLTKEFFENHYIHEKMSYPSIRKMLLSQGYNIHVGTLHKYAKRHGIGRSISESKRTLDYNKSYLNENIIEAIDGFLLGDGSIHKNKKVARLICGLEHKEFAIYLISCFSIYSSVVHPYKDEGMSSGIQYQGRTKFHPDLFDQYLRWYQTGSRKQPPNDIRITPKSVMMWYLGDGSLVQDQNTVTIRLSTDGFSPDRVEFLSAKLRDKSILCHRNNDNRIMIKARGIPAFFNFIGRNAPVRCYEYKFNLPEWRFKAKRLSEVAKDLGVSYNRISHLIKTGRLKCYRASAKGRPRMLPEHIEMAKQLIHSRELY